MRQATEVKQGDRVIYSIGGVEYPALATRDARLGFHPGAKSASVHINLVYLNESAQAVKVFDAPLLVKAACIEDLAAITDMEMAVERRRRKTEARDRSEVVSALFDAKQPFGWRPDSTADELAYLRNLLASIKSGENAQDLGAATKEIPQPGQETGSVVSDAGGGSVNVGAAEATTEEPAAETPEPAATEPEPVAEPEAPVNEPQVAPDSPEATDTEAAAI